MRLTKFTLLVWLYTVVLTVPYVLSVSGSDWLQQRFGSIWWVPPIALLFILATSAPLVYLTFVRRLEGQLLKDQRRYHQTLIAASSGMTRIKDVERLCQLIVHVVTRTVRLTHAGLFLYEPKEHRYRLHAVRHRTMMPADILIQEDDSVVRLLQEGKDILLVNELEEAGNGPSNGHTRRAAAAYIWMRKLEVRLVVPSFSDNKLLGFLVLGAKRADEPYSTDDIALFSGLANQGALAIENALVFEELRNNEAYMVQSEKLASLGQLASGMAHEIHNPLSIISGEAQLYLERFKNKNQDVDEVLKSIIEECQRAADITRRILRFAKPAPSDFVAVDIKATVEESLTLAGYQTRLERIERIVRMAKDLPKVRGNQNQLQEVILNLILNASQAMGKEGGKLILSVTSPNAQQVELRVEDTGPGIPAGKITKIFDPFYTTKETGTGLGLFVSQRIIQAHGGSMDVQSKEGEGTCFTIRLPVWRPDAVTNEAPKSSGRA